MSSDFDYCALIERTAVPMHHCVHDFFVKHLNDTLPDMATLIMSVKLPT